MPLNKETEHIYIYFRFTYSFIPFVILFSLIKVCFMKPEYSAIKEKMFASNKLSFYPFKCGWFIIFFQGLLFCAPDKLYAPCFF